MTDCLCSKTGKALYDEKTKLWCNGPTYIAELYREELKNPDIRFEMNVYSDGVENFRYYIVVITKFMKNKCYNKYKIYNEMEVLHMQKDLTTGNITPQLIRFTIPLVLGNIFQLMYNAIDSIIVGRFVGSKALAAVGICNPVSTLFILFLNGLCMGASILMGNMFGAKDL